MNKTLTLLFYTDPGTGALIWQLAAASMVGAAFYFRQYLGKLKTFVSSFKNRKVR
jgi:hypothetical protein